MFHTRRQMYINIVLQGGIQKRTAEELAAHEAHLAKEKQRLERERKAKQEVYEKRKAEREKLATSPS